MKQAIIPISIVLTILVIPNTMAQGTFEGTYEGPVDGTLQINGTSFSTPVAIEYTVASRDQNADATTQIDFDLISDTFLEPPIGGKTRIQWGFSCDLRPLTTTFATCSGTMSTDFANVPGISPDGCGQIQLTQPAGGQRENPYKEAHCDLSGGPFSGSGNVTCDIFLDDAVNPNCWWEIVQVELYSVDRSISSTTGTFEGQASGNMNGTVSNTTGGNGNVTFQDHNVTVFEGDTNVPEMRIFFWFMAFIVFLVVLAEWKQDAGYYLLATILTTITVIQMPDFLPDFYRLILIAFALFLVSRLVVAVRKSPVMGTRPEDEGDS